MSSTLFNEQENNDNSRSKGGDNMTQHAREAHNNSHNGDSTVANNTAHNEVQETHLQPAADRVNNRTLRPQNTSFKEFMTSGWDNQEPDIAPLESSAYTPERLRKLSEAFPHERLVIPAGTHKVRSNDCDYAFRPDTTFAYYTGLGQDYEAGAVLVLQPLYEDNDSHFSQNSDDSSHCEACVTEKSTAHDETASQRQSLSLPHHRAELFVSPRADNSTEAYYNSARYGEYWVGPRAGLVELEAMTGIPTRDIAHLEESLSKDLGQSSVSVRVVRETDSEITSLVEKLRQAHGFDDKESNSATDDKLHEFAAEARLIKDAYEIDQMQRAIDATKKGFDRLLQRLPHVIDKKRSERMLEGAFNSVSREEGNAVGYDSIVASGAHAPILHWMRNTGTVSTGDLLLVDAGVEVDSLYTADITRTFPVTGHFNELQKDIYETVLRAQYAGFEAARVGATYSDIHKACMRVLAQRLFEWGILPVSVEESLSPQGQQHRRWHACGCAHHLGLDVHDCAQARYEQYQGAPLQPGMIFTIEPGMYFKENDLLIPPEFRGIGVRIEDDVLMTEAGPLWLSAGIPKTVADVEKWMAEQAQQSRISE